MSFEDEKSEKIMMLIKEEVKSETDWAALMTKVMSVMIAEGHRIGITEDRLVSIITGIWFGMLYDCLPTELFQSYLEKSIKWFVENEGGINGKV